MKDWTSGYMTEVGYLPGYHPELRPQRMQLAFAERGLAAPEVRTACELGFGHGIDVNIHAAASDVQWWGTDFHPAHAAFARELAAASGADAHLFDQSFEEFCSRDDLPNFDYVALHGVWAWISERNRDAIVDFLRRKLRPGGVAYISYNTLPGWAQMVPVQNLLYHYARVMGRPADGPERRLDEALDFCEALLGESEHYARANPLLAERIRDIRRQHPSYRVHEYLARDWTPVHFMDLAERLHEAKLEFASSANYTAALESHWLTAEQRLRLAALPNRLLAEATRDFMMNVGFRGDFWVKGLRELSGAERQLATRQLRVVLVKPRALITLDAPALGLSHEQGTALLDALGSHEVFSAQELHARLAPCGIAPSQVITALLVLVFNRIVQPVQDTVPPEVGERCARLNRHIVGNAVARRNVAFAASPLTGAGIPVDGLDQLLLHGWYLGGRTDPELAAHAWKEMDALSQRLQRDGAAIQGEADSLVVLQEEARRFVAQHLPMLRALQVA